MSTRSDPSYDRNRMGTTRRPEPLSDIGVDLSRVSKDATRLPKDIF